MAAVALTLTAQDFVSSANRLAAIEGLIDMDRIEDGVGAVVESQSKRRVSQEKSSPDGTPWAAWSPGYAKTRRAGQSLMQSEGNFLDDIFADRQGGEMLVGSSLVYAAIHQFGGKAGRNKSVDIVARPVFGLSTDNRQEIEAVVSDYIDNQLGGAFQ